MAYRKKSRAKKSGRVGAVKRRSSGSTKNNAGRVLGLIGGAVLAGVASSAISKQVSNPNAAKIAAGGAVVLGFLLPRFIKGDIAAAAGAGMIAQGGYKLLQEFDVLNGIPFVAGFNDLPMINGPVPQNSEGPAQKVTAKEANDAVRMRPFRPTISQVMGSVYYRGFRDR